MLMKKKLMPTRLLGKIITFLFPADLALCLTFFQASNNDMLFFCFCNERQLTTLQNVKTPMLYVLVCFLLFVCFYYVGMLYLVQLQDEDLQFE